MYNLKKRLNKEIINYLIFGVLATIVNFVVFYVCFNLLHLNLFWSNLASWFLSVLFAFVTNKVWVFESKSESIMALLREAVLFFVARLISGAIDMALMFLFVEIFTWNSSISKLIVQVVVVVLNYVFSKLIIFKNVKSVK